MIHIGIVTIENSGFSNIKRASVFHHGTINNQAANALKLPAAAIVGVDSPIGLTVIRELGENGVPVIGIGSGNQSLGKASRWLKEFHIRPATPMKQWLPELIKKHDLKAVFAISETDLIELSGLDREIEGCRILTPRSTQLEIILDKNQTLKAAEAVGIDVPKTWQPKTDDDFEAIAEELSFPVAIKWSDPPAVMERLNQSDLEFEKIEYADNVPELLSILQRYNSIKHWPMVQTWCAGTGLGQMLHMHDGKATLEFQHRRIHEWPPSGGVSTYCASIDLELHAQQMSKSAKLLQAIDWAGSAMVEYRYDEKVDRYWLMEINGRFWGSIPLAYHCGAQFAWEAYRKNIIDDVGGAVHRERKGRKARYMIPETKRLFRILRGGSEQAGGGFGRTSSAVGYFAAFFSLRTRYYIWSWRDPRPFFSDLYGVFKKLLRLDNAD